MTIDEALLARYVANEASEAERAAVDAWLAADRDRVAVLHATRDAWERAASVRLLDTPIDTQQSLLALRRKLPTTSTTAKPLPTRRLYPASWVWGMAAAAIFGVAMLVSRDRLFPPRSTQQFREFATAAGAQATVTLRDGTQLTLGPSTHLRVPADFGRSARTVELEGEAVFRVVHDIRHPFAVRIAHATVRDVGTTFVVQAYPDDPSEQVAVVEGEVAIGSAELRANQMATIDDQARVIVRSDIDPLPYVGWSQGVLVFTDSPLRDVVRQIGRMYGAEITVPDTVLARKRITSTFTNESLDDVLDLVTHAVGAEYVRTGHAIVVRPRTAGAGRQNTVSPLPLTTVETRE